MSQSHLICQPSILYFGTPVVLISTVNEDGSPNLAPFSSIWWLGWRGMLGISNGSKTSRNLRRTRECVLNLPSVREVNSVNHLACLTGIRDVPDAKKARGYSYEPHKFEAAALTPVPSQTVAPPRVLECPVHLEAVVSRQHPMMQDEPNHSDLFGAVEVRITRAHIRQDILSGRDTNRVDPDKWRPLIMSFQKFYGLASGQIHVSRLAEIPEHLYRLPNSETL